MPARTSASCRPPAGPRTPLRVLRHHVTRTLPYSPAQLFALVGDVDAYPQFVPWIVGMRTWNSRTDSDGMIWTDAEAQVGFSFLREKFSTRVRRDPAARQIDVSLISGPFKSLRNQWTFEPEGEGTRIEFDIDFEFKSRMLAALLTSNFSSAVDKLMACFEARAKALYS